MTRVFKHWRIWLGVLGVVITFLTTPPQEIWDGTQGWLDALKSAPLPSLDPVRIVGLLLLSVVAAPTLIDWVQKVAGRGAQPGPAEHAGEGSDPKELVIFATASFIPAWHCCIDVVVYLRGQIRRLEGERNEALFQLVLDKGNPAWRALQDRMTSGSSTVPLDRLLADAYEAYELMVRWIKLGGELHDVPRAADPRLIAWREADERMTGRMTELLADPTVRAPALAGTRTSVVNGGDAALTRQWLFKRARPRSDALPLVSDLDVDGHWRRMRIHNPNDFTVTRCCVQLMDYSCESDLPEGFSLPSKGFKFGWSTTNVDKPSRYIDIGPKADAYIDLHQVIAGAGYFTHVSPGPEPDTYKPFCGLPRGKYRYSLNIISEGQEGVPSHMRVIRAVFDGRENLELSFL